MKRPPQCAFAIFSDRVPRCPEDAVVISTFEGEDVRGDAGVIGWCALHNSPPKPKLAGHGRRKVTKADHFEQDR